LSKKSRIRYGEVSFLPNPYLPVSSDLVEKEAVLFLPRLYSYGNSANRDHYLRRIGSVPGQKSMRLSKKGSDLSFPDAGFRRFSIAIPLPPPLFAESKRRELKKLLPSIFGFGACFLARATRGTGRTTT